MAEKIVSLSKNCWMPDVMAKACYKCEKNFNSFRRRHHCRYCGLLFCAKCSKIKVQLKNGALLDRSCEKCLGILRQPETKTIQQMAQYPYFPKDNSIFVEEEVEDAGTETNCDANIDLQNLFNEDIEFNIDNYKQGEFGNVEELESYLNSRCKEYLKKVNAEDWSECLSCTIKDVVRNIKPSKKDAMNLNKYVRVVRFPVEDKCRFFKGIAFKKILANKRMNSKILNPKILILSGSTGFFLGEKKIISMQKLIEQEENYTKILLDLIRNMIKPDLILIEKTMPFSIIEELTQLGISVLMNVKKKILKLVSRLSGAKILSSVNQSLYQNTEYLGTCVEFWQHKIGHNVYNFLQAAEDCFLCGSVLFNPANLDKKILKEIIMKLVVQYRSVLLERTLLSLFSVTSLNYEDFHSSGSSFIHVSTVRSKICSRPKIHEIEYYSKNGKSLGDFLKDQLTNTHEKCENICDKKLKDHKYYYFKGKGRVKIFYSKAEEILKSIHMYRECTLCGCKSELTKLSDLAWRFSVNKFIDNFFHDGSIQHSVCSHDFYKEGRFVFGLLSCRVMIQYEETKQYGIYRNPAYNDEIIKSFMVDNYQKLIEAGQRLLMELEPMKNYVYNLSLNTFSEENCMEDATLINKSIRTIEDCFNSANMIFEEIKGLKSRNYLEVEALRRSLFFPICRIIIELEGAMDLIGKIDQRKGASEALPQLEDPVKVYNNFYSLTAPLSEKFSIIDDKDFIFLQQGSLTFPVKDNTFCIPIDEDDSLTLIAYALNSQEYNDEISELFEDAEEISEKIEGELLSSKEDHFVFNETSYNNEEFTSDQQKESFRRIYGDSISIKVVAYFYKQFHGMRHYSIGSHVDFLLSISCSQKEQLHLGKSKAYFKNSIDERFIVKIVGERQFRMFMDFAPNYFRHNCKSHYHGMPSCLVSIIGAYSVQVRNHSNGKVRQEWILINENLAYCLPKNSLVYDLKGTINKRRKVQDGDERTKMDLNFVEFMNGLPIVLAPEVKKRLDAEIWNDTLFLSQQNIVDYSLLLIINTELQILNYGIIDYMEQYTFERAIESKYKTVVGAELPTIIYPKEYKNRFRQHLIQIYFMSVE